MCARCHPPPTYTFSCERTVQRKENPLHWLARKRRPTVQHDVGDVLVALCDDRELAAVALNTRNVAGDTPLMLAARVGSCHVVWTMLRYGANPVVKNAVRVGVLSSEGGNSGRRWRVCWYMDAYSLVWGLFLHARENVLVCTWWKVGGRLDMCRLHAAQVMSRLPAPI